MTDRIDQLNAMLSASQGRPGHEQRIKAIEAEISKLGESNDTGDDTGDANEEGSDTDEDENDGSPN